MKYPRIYVSEKVHAKVLRAAKKQKKSMKDMGDEIVLAGLRALGFIK